MAPEYSSNRTSKEATRAASRLNGVRLRSTFRRSITILNPTMKLTLTCPTGNLNFLISHFIMGGLQYLWYESIVSQHGVDCRTNSLAPSASVRRHRLDWSYFLLHFVENAMATTFDTNAARKILPPKVSIQSIPKPVHKPIRQEFKEPLFEFWTLQMTETGLFAVCVPAHLQPEESTPEGEFRSSYIKTSSELTKIWLFDLGGSTVVNIIFMLKQALVLSFVDPPPVELFQTSAFFDTAGTREIVIWVLRPCSCP